MFRRRFKRSSYRRRQMRRPIKRRRIRRSLKSKSSNMVRKAVKRDKQINIVDLGRQMLPNVVIKRFTKVNTLELLRQGTAAAGQQVVSNGTFTLDYVLSHFMNADNLLYYTKTYSFWNLLGFEIAFYIVDSKHLTKLVQILPATPNQYIQSQCTLPSRMPQMYIHHATNASTQALFTAFGASTANATQAWLSSPHTKRLGQPNRAIYKWTMPVGYIPTFATIPAITTTIGNTFSGPPYGEPHGFCGLWNDHAEYAGLATVTLGFKITAICAFKDPLPAVTG